MTLDVLPPDAREPLERAERKRLSYAVRYLSAPGPEPRLLVVLGEAHVKLGAASALGKEIIAAFALRGVESFQRKRVAFGRVLWLLIHVPRLALRALSFGAIKGSTITDAKALGSGHTVELEASSRIPLSLHAGAVYLSAFFGVFWLLLALQVSGATSAPPGALRTFTDALTLAASAFQLHMAALVPAWLLRRTRWGWVVHPLIAILTTRDVVMVEGTVGMLRDYPERAAVVIMGRAHVAGYVALLIEQHGFTEVVR